MESLKSFNTNGWLQVIVNALIFVLPLYLYIKNHFKDKQKQRDYDARERALDREAREKENIANMEKVFTILYKDANRELIDAFKELQKDYKSYLMEFIKR